jgi:ligand-binding SRPBCC domain-containing protein
MSQIHHLYHETRIKKPIDEVFLFFSDAKNLEKITPAQLKFRIITPGLIEMKEGALIRYKLRLNGIPFSWLTEISEWEPPHRFTDTQLKGPYKKWVHTHSFREDGQETIINDHVQYQLPNVPFSEIVHRWYVRKQVEHIFEYREQVIQKLFSHSVET